MEKIGVVLLAAGYGTRMYPLTKDTPKALLSLGDVVVLDEILERVSSLPRLSKVVLVTNRRFFGQFQDWQATRRTQVEPHGQAPARPETQGAGGRGSSGTALRVGRPACAAKRSGAAGRHPAPGRGSLGVVELVDDGSLTPEARLGAIRDLLLALERLDRGEDALVVGTDNLFTWELRDFVAFANERRPAATIALRQAPSLEEARRGAVVELDAGKRIVRCAEKPAQPSSLTTSLCVYYFPAPCRARIEEFARGGGNVDAPGYLIEWLATQEPVYGFLTDGESFDIGSPEMYQQALHWWRSVPHGARRTGR